MEALIAQLRRGNHFLMVDEDGVEVYNEEGNLVVSNTNGECMAVPNTKEVRMLYDLSIVKDEIDQQAGQTSNKQFDDSIGEKNNILPDSLDGFECADSEKQFVWMGQRSKECEEATKSLIKLFDTPKYLKLMNDKSTIKSKIWEKIACELEDQGFKIADSIKEAGLRTFQKWRNMERTYWRYLRNPEQFGEDKRRKKPTFFDDIHSIIKKRNTHLFPPKIGPTTSDGDITVNTVANHNKEVDTGDLPNDTFRSPQESLSKEVVSSLIYLATSQKYKNLINNHKYQKTKVWEHLYEDMASAGLDFAKTKREGAVKLANKWRNLEKIFLRQQCKAPPKSMYTASLRKSILLDVAKQKKDKSNIESSSSGDQARSLEVRRLKEGGIAPKAVEALLKLIGSDRFQGIFIGCGKKTGFWERIYDEMESMGYEIAGKTKLEKSQRLFQKWRNMKRGFIKYQIGKDTGRKMKKPVCYDLLFKIISKEVLKERPKPVEHVEFMHVDHNYVSDNNLVHETSSASEVVEPPPSPPACALTTTPPYDTIPNILLEIKALHENALSVQKENFSKLIALLEEQTKHQKILTSLFTHYVTNISKTNKSKSKKNHKTDDASKITHVGIENNCLANEMNSVSDAEESKINNYYEFFSDYV